MVSAELMSWLGAVQAFIITAIFADGRRIGACWFGLCTEPVWIATPFLVGNGTWGYATLGVGFMLSYVWGLVRDKPSGYWVRAYMGAYVGTPLTALWRRTRRKERVET